MPALYALAQHDSLVQAASQLHPGESILAFLVDIYVIADRERAREVFNIVSHAIESGAGIRTHLGKLKGWSRSFSSRPPGFDDFGNDF